MTIEKPKIEKEPIVDIGVNEATLEQWEKKGLKKDVSALIKDFERLIPLGNKFRLCPANFATSNTFINHTRWSLEELEGKNLDEKIKEVEDDVRKAILNFTFEELEVNPENPVLLKEEEKEENGEKVKIKYFATAYPNLVLVHNGIDWWLERK